MPYKSREYKNLHEKLKYQERVAKGLCGACGDEIDEHRKSKGYVLCSFCASKRKQARKRWFNACDHHDCSTCPHEYCISDEKKADRRLQQAHENTRKSFVAFNERNKKAGLCQRCGAVIEEGMTGHNCRRCQDMQNRNSRRRRVEKPEPIKIIDDSMCHVCHKAPVVYGYKVCEKCLKRIHDSIDRRRDNDGKLHSLWCKEFVFGKFWKKKEEK